MSHKLGICIPYRNREEHLKKLIPHLSKHLNDQEIEHKFYVGHQVDDKLFNRGAMKNIAAKYAFDDGCDYVAWHDVDMLPKLDADYSYPTENPLHIATKLSKYNYTLGYDQYFGGVILFTKEQVEKTNGYSNDYWDWGMEDDDLFWRCYFEGMTTGKIFKNYTDKSFGYFDGTSSHVEIANRTAAECLNKNHTISVLVSAEQQTNKVPIFLIGDEEKQFIEYPILTKSGGYSYMLSFNNSRAYTMRLFNDARTQIYNWIKRFENMWTWITISVNTDTKEIYFYLNDELVRNINDVKEKLPVSITGNGLLRYDMRNPFYLGFDKQTNNRFKGKISEIKVYNKYFTPEEISTVLEKKTTEGLVFEYDFTNNDNIVLNNVKIEKENINIIENIIPYRKEGSFECLEHIDEGFKNGTWAKGETTARNEKRFIMEMQQNKINYKSEGYNEVLDIMEIVNINETDYHNTVFINVNMK
jgi:hypothetical protein